MGRDDQVTARGAPRWRALQLHLTTRPMSSFRLVTRLLSLLLLLLAPTTALLSQSAPCARAGACAEVPAFTVAITDFRTSTVDRGTRVLTATLRIMNRTAEPLVLGYVTGSGIATDDQGNRYAVYGATAVRGIGEIANGNVDTKFTLRPGEASDARLEFMFAPPNRNTILGTSYDLDVAIRQVDLLAGNQVRLGKEHSLHFTGFGAPGAVASGVTSGSRPRGMAPPPASTGALPTDGDQCGGRARCYGAGTFVAEVTQFAAGAEGRHHVLRATIRLRNMSAEPIILAYKATTSGASDDLGNRYYFGRPGTYDMSVAGIGKVEGSKADPQFQLRPGESRDARFTLYRFEGAKQQHGTTFSHDLSFVLLEPLPSGQVRVGREFAVSFAKLSVGGSDAVNAAGGQAARRLIEALTKKKP